MKQDKIPRGEAWVRLLETLRPKKEIMGEQFPKALKDYPELTISLSANVGYLTFLIERTRRRLRAGIDSDIPDIDELDDHIYRGVSEPVLGLTQFDYSEIRKMMEKVREFDPRIPPMLELMPITCEDLIKQYREAAECFENISDGLPPGEYIAAVQRCLEQLEEIRQQIVDEGCICDLLYEEYTSAVECFENIPDGLSDSEHLADVQSCLEQLEDIQRRMSEWGCEY